MRIAFVVHDFNRAFGHGRYVAELAGRFAPTHDVHVFSNTVAANDARIEWHHVPALRMSALTTILSFYPAASMAMGRGFDIVHAQGFSVAGANVITAHISNGKWMEARRELCNGRLPWQERLFGSIVSPLERRALRSRAATIIAVSSALQRDLRAEGIASPMAVIPHGVDPSQFNPGVRERLRRDARHTLRCADHDIVFLFVGDLRKGFAHAVKALATTPGRLVGVTRSEPTAMMALAQATGVADRVHIVPASPEIERYYAAADVFVFPTQYDAFGLVITEAMACGVPVITSGAAGAAELIEQGRTGFVVADPADVESLAAHMRRLAADPIERDRLGRQAAEAMKAHSWDNVAIRTMAVYEGIVRTRNSAAA